MKKTLSLFLSVFLFISCITTAFGFDYDTHWAKSVIKRWFDAKVLSGDGNGNFMPDRPISRAEFLKLLLSSADEPLSYMNTVSPFSDVKQTDWYYNYAVVGYNRGVLSGYDNGDFLPNNIITRQDAFIMLCRYYGFYVDNQNKPEKIVDIDNATSYAKNSICYMVNNGYVKGYIDGTIRPLNSLTRAEAIVMLDRMMQNSPNVNPNKLLTFSNNYPKALPASKEGYIDIRVRLNKACNVYYLLVERTANKQTQTPPIGGVNKLLMQVSKENETVEASIKADINKAYDLFIIATNAKDTTGIVRFYNIRPMMFESGNGSNETPYIISNEKQLRNIRYFPDKSFELGNDVNITDDFVQIPSFLGVLNGAGKKIKNLTLSEHQDDIGFFKTIDKNATIENLYIENAKIYAGIGVGIIAGTNNGTIKSCYVTGNVQASTNVGAIVGTNNGTICDVVSSANVIGKNYAAGIVGTNNGTITRTMCIADNVSSDLQVAGICANNKGSITNNVVAVKKLTDFSSGLSGRVCGGTKGVTDNNFCWIDTIVNFDTQIASQDNYNGASLMMPYFKDMSFYQKNLGFDFDGVWSMQSLTADDTYILPVLKNTSNPTCVAGNAFYSPIAITSIKDFELVRNNLDKCFILVNDIDIYNDNNIIKSNFVSIGSVSEKDTSSKSAFNGILDGNGKTISGLQINTIEDSENNNKNFAAIFGVIGENGVVSDIKIKTSGLIKFPDKVFVPAIKSSSYAGAIAAINYGKIRSVTVNASVGADAGNSNSNTGGIVGANYGLIFASKADVTEYSNANNTNIGGICGYNEGYVLNSEAKVDIDIISTGSFSSSNSGGIVGFNTSGIVQSCYSDNNINVSGYNNYVGGIVGMNETAVVRYSYSTGSINSTANNSKSSSGSFVGGISGINNNSVITDCYSLARLNANSYRVFCGGISGYSVSSNLLNSYSTSEIDVTATASGSVGGIIGMTEKGMVSCNAAINKGIKTNDSNVKVARICGSKDSYGLLQGNIALEGMLVNGYKAMSIDRELDGNVKSADLLKAKRTYTDSVLEGGLGWYAFGDVNGMWQWNVNSNYRLPVLYMLPYQEVLNDEKFIK